MSGTEDKILVSRCQNLLNTYGDLLLLVAEEIKKEQDGPINLDSVELIALEYKRKQGVKQGLTLLIQRINTKANERN